MRLVKGYFFKRILMRDRREKDPDFVERRWASWMEVSLGQDASRANVAREAI